MAKSPITPHVHMQKKSEYFEHTEKKEEKKRKEIKELKNELDLLMYKELVNYI